MYTASSHRYYFSWFGLQATEFVCANLKTKDGQPMFASLPGGNMSVRNAIVLLLAFSTILFLAGCGSSSPKTIAPPSGGFSKASLSGTYVFSTAGSDATTGDPLNIVGAFVADGNGSVKSGSIDVVDVGLGVSSNQAITGGSYSITPDGRGVVQLNASTVLASGLGLDIVLSSSSHGLVTEFDGAGTGSGTIDLQSSSSALTGSYSFNLSGTGSTTSFEAAGSLTLGGSGNVTAGLVDFLDGTSGTLDLPIGATSTVLVGTGTAPGTAQLVTTSRTIPFDVYVIDSTHFKLIETDTQFFSSGDAYAAATSLPTSGTLAFTMTGFNLTTSPNNPLALGGLMPVGAGSSIAAGGVEDFNDGGNVNEDTTFAGGFTALTGGRSVLSLTGFVNGAANDIAGTYSFAAYPFTSNGVSGFELLEIDGLGVTSGAAFIQTSTTFAASQGYGLNLGGINVTGGAGAYFEEDDIAEFQTTSSSYSGIVDVNDEGMTSFKQTLAGSYAAAGTGRFTATTTKFFNFNFYPVDASTFLLLETDAGQIGAGIIELQNASGSAGPEPGLSIVRSAARAHAVLRRK
jgi:hypothetical protein